MNIAISKKKALQSLAAVFPLLFISCGYHVAGKADLMPKTVQTIAIPAFTTFTTSYKLADQIPEAIAREFKARTRFRIVDDPGQADATLSGSINAVVQSPNIYDPSSGKATNVQVTVTLALRLVERTTGRVLYSRPSLTTRENYNIPTNSHDYFNESRPAFDRLSAQVARDVVSSVIENF